MSIQQQNRLVAGVFLAVDVKIPEEILLHFAQSGCVGTGSTHHLVFKTGSTGGIGKFLQQAQRMFGHFHGIVLLFFVGLPQGLCPRDILFY